MSERFHRFALSAAFLSDHLSRLYVQAKAPPLADYDHVDQAGARVLCVRWTAKTATATFTPAALADLIADAEYQAEFTEEPSYRAQARRVIARARKISQP